MCLIVSKKPSIKRPNAFKTFDAGFSKKNLLPATEQLLKFVHTLKSPKTVYKLFFIQEDNKNRNYNNIYKTLTLSMTTPYRGKSVSMHGDIMTNDGFFSCFYYKTYFYENYDLMLRRGIHSFTDKNKAKSQILIPDRYIVLECIIPPNTPFVYGKEEEIASLQLIVPPVKKENLPSKLRKYNHWV